MTEKGLSLPAPDPGPVAADSRRGLACSPVTGLCCSHGPSHLPEHADQGQGRGHSLGPQGPSRDYGGVKPSLFSVRADSSKLCGPRGVRCGTPLGHRPAESATDHTGKGAQPAPLSRGCGVGRPSDHRSLRVPQPGSRGSRRALCSALRLFLGQDRSGSGGGVRVPAAPCGPREGSSPSASQEGAGPPPPGTCL